MNDIFQCGDSAALVAYLYDECGPGERQQIAAHLEQCSTCASEVDTLSATRRTLAAWTPPDLALGFQITRASAVGPAKVLERKIAWWRAPMPAWAQVAAALVIFAAGLSVGLGSSGRAAAQRTSSDGRAGTPAATASRDDLAQLEQRIRAELGQIRSAGPATPLALRGSDEALIQQVKAMLEQSEATQRREFTLRMVDLAFDIEKQRRDDFARMGQSVGQWQNVVGTELRQQREALGVLVSERTR
jgi:anti-sigma factor RsiW